MKHWQETEELLKEAARQQASGKRTALATVVRIEGSAYRRPGAKLLITEGGAMSGGVSGGCLEADVREVALGVIRTGKPALRMYDTSGDEQQVWGLGMGCNGMVEVFIESLTDSPAIRRLREQLQGDQPISRDIVIADNPRRVFTDTLEPPPRLIICGAGDDARPLAALAHQAGFRVTVLDHRPAYLAAERFAPGIQRQEARAEAGLDSLGIAADSCVAIMTHSEAHDRAWLRAALASPAGYIGLLGPRRRGEKLLGALGAEASDRVFTPVGLDVGADGPEQIAVSIVAELLAARSGREGSHLRNRQAGIHGG